MADKAISVSLSVGRPLIFRTTFHVYVTLRYYNGIFTRPSVFKSPTGQETSFVDEFFRTPARNNNNKPDDLSNERRLGDRHTHARERKAVLFSVALLFRALGHRLLGHDHSRAAGRRREPPLFSVFSLQSSSCVSVAFGALSSSRVLFYEFFVVRDSRKRRTQQLSSRRRHGLFAHFTRPSKSSVTGVSLIAVITAFRYRLPFLPSVVVISYSALSTRIRIVSSI